MWNFDFKWSFKESEFLKGLLFFLPFGTTLIERNLLAEEAHFPFKKLSLNIIFKKMITLPDVLQNYWVVKFLMLTLIILRVPQIRQMVKKKTVSRKQVIISIKQLCNIMLFFMAPGKTFFFQLKFWDTCLILVLNIDMPIRTVLLMNMSRLPNNICFEQ